MTDVDLEFRRGYERYIDTRSIGCEKKRRTKNDRQVWLYQGETKIKNRIEIYSVGLGG